MSAKLAMQVLQSDLPATLKPTAVALALFANDAGARIFPSVGRLVWMVGLKKRAIQNHLKWLRESGVLIAKTPLTRGRGLPVHYQFNVDALPTREPYKPSSHVPGLEAEKGAPGCTLTEQTSVGKALQRVQPSTERVQSSAERVQSAALKGAPGCIRSFSDQSVRSSKDQSGKICAPDGAPVSPTKRKDPERKFTNIVDLIRTTNPELARRWAEDTARLQELQGRTAHI